MNGEITTFNSIVASSAITDLLTSISGYPAVSIGTVEPDTWDNTMNTISLYSGAIETKDNRMVNEITANVRARTYNDCNEIADALRTALDRQKAGLYGMYTVDMLQTINPQTPEDSYNKPILIKVKAIREIE